MITDFDGLNFTLGNEDVSLEWEIAPEGVAHAVAVAGSGVRPMAIAARAPRVLTCVDTAPEQLWFSEMRFATARELCFPEFSAFWGYPGSGMTPGRRRELFRGLEMSAPAREFCEAFFEHCGWRSVLYAGKWERLQRLTSHPHRWVLGEGWKEIFSAGSMEGQRKIAAKELQSIRWKMAIGMTAASMRLYFSLFRKRLPEPNFPGGFGDYFHGAFGRALTDIPVRKALMLQLMFCGRLECLEACPVEAWPEVFASLQKALREGTEVRYVKGDVLEVASGLGAPVDFLALSNVPTYFVGEVEKGFLQRLRPSLAHRGVVVWRADLHLPRDVDTTGFARLTREFAQVIAAEGTQLYEIEVCQRN